MNLFELGQSLKRARIAMRITQSELAAKTGIGLSSISGLERGTLSEIGAVKLILLFGAVGLEIRSQPKGLRRTLDDARRESEVLTDNGYESTKLKLRVRHSRKNNN